MAARHSLHVALTEPLVRHVREQVATGRYSTASEVLREALRLMMERDAEPQTAGSKSLRAVARHV